MTITAVALPRRRFATVFGALAPRVPRSVWIVQGGMLANSIGTGVVLPFVLIYLHDVRGFSFATAGLAVGALGAAGIAMTPIAGTLIDRVGARRMLIWSLVLLACAYALFPLIRSPWHAFVLLAAAGLGNGALWPSHGTLLVAVTPAERRHAAFALSRLVGNLGLGLGTVAGGLIATTSEPSTFTVLFVFNGATFLVFAFAALLIPTPPRTEPQPGRPTGSYAAVLRDRPFLAFVAINTVFVAAGYAQLEAALPVFAKHEAGLTESAIGFLFLANVLVVVLVQMPVSRLIEGRRRMRVLALMTVVWASAWIVVGAAGLYLEAAAAALMLGTAVVCFALGECLHGPISGAVAADLAPEELRGRYMALSSSSFALGFALGPAAAGIVLGLSAFALWPVIAAACLAAGGCALALERRLPEQARLTPVAA
jgi:MFS family permease